MNKIRSMYVSAVLATLVVFAGCAPLNRPRVERDAGEDPPKVCSKSPLHSVEIFMQGIAEFSITLLTSVVPHGASVLSIFAQGRATVQELVDHPEIQNGSDVGSSYQLVAAPAESPGVLRALIRRDVTVSPQGKPEVMREEAYMRTFRVFFDLRTNCITRVNSVDPAWVRIE